jgi:hypothetical protein
LHEALAGRRLTTNAPNIFSTQTIGQYPQVIVGTTPGAKARKGSAITRWTQGFVIDVGRRWCEASTQAFVLMKSAQPMSLITS